MSLQRGRKYGEEAVAIEENKNKAEQTPTSLPEESYANDRDHAIKLKPGAPATINLCPLSQSEMTAQGYLPIPPGRPLEFFS